MSTLINRRADHLASEHEKENDKVAYGFWVYLMTDCVLFASLFATYAVLRNSTFGGPSAQELFSLPFVLTETLILLTSSFVCGFVLLGAMRRSRAIVLGSLSIVIALGAAFIGMELYEFAALVAEGNSWQRSGFLSAFFTLVGTHGLHISVGLLWAVVLLVYILRQGITPLIAKRLTLFTLFWHFLDIIWIFIFTIVYLMGAIGI